MIEKFLSATILGSIYGFFYAIGMIVFVNHGNTPNWTLIPFIVGVLLFGVVGWYMDFLS